MSDNKIEFFILNEFDHTGIAAEVKRNPSKIDLTALNRKIQFLFPFTLFHVILKGLFQEAYAQ